MKLRYLCLVFLPLLSACSIQVSGMQGAYQPPNDNASVATLLAYSTTKIISIDSKSVDASQFKLTPGNHQITLYAGKNNYQSDTNTMYVLSANFQANIKYIAKSTSNAAWIETNHGERVSSTISRMKVKKEISL